MLRPVSIPGPLRLLGGIGPAVPGVLPSFLHGSDMPAFLVRMSNRSAGVFDTAQAAARLCPVHQIGGNVQGIGGHGIPPYGGTIARKTLPCGSVRPDGFTGMAGFDGAADSFGLFKGQARFGFGADDCGFHDRTGNN